MRNHLPRCRLCGVEQGSRKFYEIFDSSLNLEEKINKLLPIVVMQWDPLPHEICGDCVAKLNFLDEFYDRSKTTEDFLRTVNHVPKCSVKALEPIIKIPHLCACSGFKLKVVEQQPSHLQPKIESKNEEVVNLDNSDSDMEVEVVEPEKLCSIARPKKTLECFIITSVSKTDSVYTCRQCYRTYTTVNSSLSHVCVEDDHSNDNSDVDVVENVHSTSTAEPQRSASPSTNHLVKGKKYVCEVCQMSFRKKSKLLAHEKAHFEDGGKSILYKFKKMKRKKSRHEKHTSKDLKDKSPKKKSPKSYSQDLDTNTHRTGSDSEELTIVAGSSSSTNVMLHQTL